MLKKLDVVRGLVVGFFLNLFVCGMALAQTTTGSGPDLSQMTSQVNYTNTQVAVMAIGVAIVGLFLTIVGVKIVLRMIRGST